MGGGRYQNGTKIESLILICANPALAGERDAEVGCKWYCKDNRMEPFCVNGKLRCGHKSVHFSKTHGKINKEDAWHRGRVLSNDKVFQSFP